MFTVNPDLFIFFEAEYWPLIYFKLFLKSIPILNLNARISPASFKRYRIIKPLISWMFEIPSKIGTVSESDKSRMVRLGASPDRIIVTGSSKYDYIFNLADTKRKRAVMWRKMLNIDNSMPVFVAGNLRKEECLWVSEVALSLYSKFPDALYILAPRHMQRTAEIINFFKEHNIPCFLLSDAQRGRTRPEGVKVILADFIGALFELYALGKANFCGGTMVPVGGHNILEPVAYGKKVIYGRHTFKISSEHDIISKHDAGIVVKNASELESVVTSIFLNPERGLIKENKLLKIRKYFSSVPEIYSRWILNMLWEEPPQ